MEPQKLENHADGGVKLEHRRGGVQGQHRREGGGGVGGQQDGEGGRVVERHRDSRGRGERRASSAAGGRDSARGMVEIRRAKLAHNGDWLVDVRPAAPCRPNPKNRRQHTFRNASTVGGVHRSPYRTVLEQHNSTTERQLHLQLCWETLSQRRPNAIPSAIPVHPRPPAGGVPPGIRPSRATGDRAVYSPVAPGY